MFWFDLHWQLQHILNQWWWPINIILGIIAAFTLFYALKKPIVAVCITIIFLPAYLFRTELFSIPFTFLELLILLTFIGWFISKIAKKEWGRLFNFRYKFPILLIVAGATIGLFVAPDFKQAAGLWKAYFIEPLIFFMVLSDVLKNTAHRKYVVAALGAPALIISGLALYQYATAFAIAEPAWIPKATRRTTAIFTSPNAVGLFLVPVIALYGGWLLHSKKNLYALIKLAVLLLSLAAIITTKSEGSFLALAGVAFFFSLFLFGKKITFFAIVAAMIILLSVPATRNEIANRTIFTQSGQNRIALWNFSVEILQDARTFVQGAGIAGFEKLQNGWRNPLVMEPLLYPHNILLNFWLEVGIIGLFGFILLFVQFFRRGLSTKPVDYWKVGVMAAMISVLIQGFIDVPYFKNDLSVLFWVIVALL